ncbi:MAG TPA: hypothetical protein VKG92_06670, partial [Flavobacteriales bacterium]|nr:hypothetical protein [Flavobacteriales bacterium]
MMRRSLPFLFIGFAATASAQTGSPEQGGEPDQEYTIPGHFDTFTTDELGNVYALHGDVLELYNAQGRSWL